MSVDISDLIRETLNDLQDRGENLLAEANAEDRIRIRELLEQASEMTVEHISGQPQNEDLAHIEAALSDIALKYGFQARSEMQDAVSDFLSRVISVIFDAAIPHE